MKIINEALLTEFHSPGPCDICGKFCHEREPHHFRRRGFGGGSRLDISINLLALGSTPRWECQCHTRIHAGELTACDELNAIAKREKAEPDDIARALYFIERLDKGFSPWLVTELISREPDAVAALVRRSLEGHA